MVCFGIFITQIPNCPFLVQIPILFVQFAALLMSYFNCVILFHNVMSSFFVKSNSKRNSKCNSKSNSNWESNVTLFLLVVVNSNSESNGSSNSNLESNVTLFLLVVINGNGKSNGISNSNCKVALFLLLVVKSKSKS